jgi:dinuclear metal center YbgI/SA1388 family protein
MITANAATVDDVAKFLEDFAPVALAADWDNVGLLLGDRSRAATRIMTCLTVDPAVVDEAIAERVDLIVSHHPLPFRALKTITADAGANKLVWRLASAGIALYSPHTAFDSALDGINQNLAARLGLIDITPLEPIAAAGDPRIGIGRRGRLPKAAKLADVVAAAKRALKIATVDVVGEDVRPVTNVAVACGSAGELLDAALRSRCDLFVTGEARFHTAAEAAAEGIALLLLGHYASERFGVEHLADVISKTFPQAAVWPSRHETDPLRRV